jgi:hypothetical protein
LSWVSPSCEKQIDLNNKKSPVTHKSCAAGLSLPWIFALNNVVEEPQSKEAFHKHFSPKRICPPQKNQHEPPNFIFGPKSFEEPVGNRRKPTSLSSRGPDGWAGESCLMMP